MEADLMSSLDPVLFIRLDGGDVWVNIQEIACIRQIHVSAPGDRSRITLKSSGVQFDVPETPQQVFDMVHGVMMAFAEGKNGSVSL